MAPPVARLLILFCLSAFSAPARADFEAEERRLSDLAIDLMLEGQERILRIADPIRLAGRPFCDKQVGPVLGIYAADRYSFADLFGRREYAQPFIQSVGKRFDLKRSPRVLVVRSGSPAAEAGMRPGDLITAINGKKLKGGVQLDGLGRRATKAANGKVRFGIQRENGGPPSRRHEADADYLGLYLAARAGFDVSVAPSVWERFARKNPYSTIDWGVYRHPSSPERSLALRAALDEIASKRERGEELWPEEK